MDAVVVGASAGGVDALATLLAALPGDAGVALLAVIHLPRDSRGLLAQVLAPRCALPVEEAQDKEPVRAGRVYLAPPDYHLLVDHGPRTALSVDEPVHFSRPAIDVLFESAADVYGARLLGMVLTGGSADGAAGLAAVHRAGGLTAVQSPQDAQVPLMPQAALEAVAPDFVLPLPGLAALLAGLGSALP